MVSFNPFSQIRSVVCLYKPSTQTVLATCVVVGLIAIRFSGLELRKMNPFALVTAMVRAVAQVFQKIIYNKPVATSHSEQPSTMITVQTPSNSEGDSEHLSTIAQSNDSPADNPMPLTQLVKSLLVANDESGDMSPEDLNHPVLMGMVLAGQVQNVFKLHAAEGEEAVANALAPLFSRAKGNPEKFEILLNLTVFESRYSPLFVAAVLEKLIWPTEKMKEEKLHVYLGTLIANNFLSAKHHQPIVLFGSKTCRLVVMTEQIFGCKDFIKSAETIPPSLAQAIGHAIRLYAQGAEEEWRREGIYGYQPDIGFELVFEQSMECRFPASMLTPVLPYLKNISGLVGLKMKVVDGFRDQDANALLDIFNTNPGLLKYNIDIGGMTPGTQGHFERQLQQIMDTRERMLSGAPNVLNVLKSLIYHRHSAKG
jgi:hypothetical protein